jgi:hypothetical protein
LQLRDVALKSRGFKRPPFSIRKQLQDILSTVEAEKEGHRKHKSLLSPFWYLNVPSGQKLQSGGFMEVGIAECSTTGWRDQSNDKELLRHFPGPHGSKEVDV